MPYTLRRTMAHPSKRKGDAFEREIVAAFQAAGLRAERAFMSDGRALRTDTGKACTPGVDVLVEGALKVQAKRRASVAAWAKPPAGAHVTVIREDRGEAVAVLPLDLFVRLVGRCYQGTPGGTP